MREMLHICYMQYVDSLRMQNVAKENETLSRHHKKKQTKASDHTQTELNPDERAKSHLLNRTDKKKIKKLFCLLTTFPRYKHGINSKYKLQNEKK